MPKAVFINSIIFSIGVKTRPKLALLSYKLLKQYGGDTHFLPSLKDRSIQHILNLNNGWPGCCHTASISIAVLCQSTQWAGTRVYNFV